MIIVSSTQFKKDYKALQESKKDLSKVDEIIRCLGCDDFSFESKYKIYPMDYGWMKGLNYFTIIVQKGLNLVYKKNISNNEVYLARLGENI